MLAAVMFTDIVGYTALMQNDESQAKTIRDRHRDILERKISAHKGRILQYYGDGTLSVFGSALEATRCAIMIQRAMQDSPAIPMRIGIHVGDIVYVDEGVYGDGVNIAARIEALSMPGSVLISSRVREELHNQPTIAVSSLGVFDLKNVKEPIEIFAVSAEGLNVPTAKDVRAKTAASYKSIAVLPFVNMSADPDNEFFSDGIAEEIINALVKVDGLRVTSRTSSFALKGLNEDIRDIGAKLGVSTVLEGSVRKAGMQLRITAQLINAVDGFHIWSETFDRKTEDIFAVQDEIAKSIATAMREKLALRELRMPLVKPPTSNLKAYTFYLKGLHFWNKWTPGDINLAIDQYKAATQLEPRFALAYSGLAGCYVFLGASGQANAAESFVHAKEFARKALELDDTLAESHVAMGMVNLWREWNWSAAETSFKRAYELGAGTASVRHAYSVFLAIMGRPNKSIAEAEKALALDPLSLPINDWLGQTYFYAQRFDDAIEQYRKTLELSPTFRTSRTNLGWAHIVKGDTETAIELFLEVQRQTGDELKATAPLCYAYARFGDREKAREYLHKLELRTQREPHISLEMDFALAYSGLEEYDAMYASIEQAIEKRMGLGMIKITPLWLHLHSDQRFQGILRRIGL